MALSRRKEDEFEPCGRADQQRAAARLEGEERMAPNGRLAVLVNELWAGYLCIEGGGSRGGGSREIAMFHVETIDDGKSLMATFRGNVTGKDKKALNKRIYHDKDIKMYEAKTPTGDRCQLFTL